MNEEIPRVAACSRKKVIARRDHENRAAQDWLAGDKQIVIPMVGVEIRQYWRQARHVLEKPNFILVGVSHLHYLKHRHLQVNECYRFLSGKPSHLNEATGLPNTEYFWSNF